MRPNVLQLELFPEYVPIGERAPKLTLPWGEREEIDSQRAAKILGVSLPTRASVSAESAIAKSATAKAASAPAPTKPKIKS